MESKSKIRRFRLLHLESELTKKEVKIELGCGSHPKDGFIGIDIRDYGQPIIWDITEGLPFEDSSVDEIYSQHCLEHIAKEDIRGVWEEMYRVLKEGHIAKIIVPHVNSDAGFLHDHLSQWNELAVNCLCNLGGSEDHNTNTNFELILNLRVNDELHIEVVAHK